MNQLRYAVFGCGFWSHYQISGWKELEGLELVAVYNRTISKAHKIAEKFNVRAVYDDPKKLLKKEKLDFVDIITDVDTHLKFTEMAAKKGLDVVCQKPMAPSWGDAKKLVGICKNNKVNLFINENFRWQAPDYAVVHSSIVDAQRDILKELQGGKAETTGRDNLKTMQLVYSCYKSAKTGKLIKL